MRIMPNDAYEHFEECQVQHSKMRMSTTTLGRAYSKCSVKTCPFELDLGNLVLEEPGTKISRAQS